MTAVDPTAPSPAHLRTGSLEQWDAELARLPAVRRPVAYQVAVGGHVPHYAEESDAHGRSARFPEGWWIAPGILLGLALYGFLAAQAIPQAALDAQAAPECGAPC